MSNPHAPAVPAPMPAYLGRLPPGDLANPHSGYPCTVFNILKIHPWKFSPHFRAKNKRKLPIFPHLVIFGLFWAIVANLGHFDHFGYFGLGLGFEPPTSHPSGPSRLCQYSFCTDYACSNVCTFRHL